MSSSNSTLPTRTMPKTGLLDGASYFPKLSNSFEAFANYCGGNVKNITGTNDYKFSLDVVQGLSNVPDGMEISVIIPNANTGAVTFEIVNADGSTLGLNAKAVLLKNQDEMGGGELQQDIMYSFRFFGGTINSWILISEPSVLSAADAESGGAKPYIFARSFLAGTHTFTTPHKCAMKILVFGAGGSGYYSGSGFYNSGGGGAGGNSIKEIIVDSGVDLTINVGSAVDDQNGENSSVSASNINSNSDSINITASGGSAGSTSAGGAGGSSTGGDHNFSGGSGGFSSSGGTGGIIGLIENGVNGTKYNFRKMDDRFLFINISPFKNLNIFDIGTTSPQGIGGGGIAGAKVYYETKYNEGGDGLVVIEYSRDLDA